MRPSSRQQYALILFAGALLLIGAIFLGNRMGSKTIFEANRAAQPEAIVTIPPTTAPTAASIVERLWKKEQIVRVAGDPGFPDPHVSPPPTPTPMPTRRPTPTPAPTPDRTFNPNIPVWRQTLPPDENTPGATQPAAAPTPTPTDPRFPDLQRSN